MCICVIQRTEKESGKAYVFFDSVKLFPCYYDTR